MHSIMNTSNNHFLYNLPSKEDYHYIHQLLNKEFYQFVKSNWIIDDIIEGKTLLPFTNRVIHTDLEFNYSISNNNQQFVGYIKGYYPLTNHSLWIQILAINSPYVRRGYGRIIMKELVLHLLKKSSINDIYLTCHNNNLVGIRFWESLGFQKMYNIKSTHGLYRTDLRSLSCIPNHLKP